MELLQWLRVVVGVRKRYTGCVWVYMKKGEADMMYGWWSTAGQQV